MGLKHKWRQIRGMAFLRGHQLSWTKDASRLKKHCISSKRDFFHQFQSTLSPNSDDNVAQGFRQESSFAVREVILKQVSQASECRGQPDRHCLPPIFDERRRRLSLSCRGARGEEQV